MTTIAIMVSLLGRPSTHYGPLGSEASTATWCGVSGQGVVVRRESLEDLVVRDV